MGASDEFTGIESMDTGLILAHSAFVRRMARDLARDVHEAEELEQDTWLMALRRGEKARSRAWLARAMRGLARTQRRSRWRRSERERRASVLDETACEESPDELVARIEGAQRLVSAVLELTEPQRTIVLLYYERGLATRQIAARTGLPDGTVRAELFRARGRLREQLDRGPGGRAAWLAAIVPHGQAGVTVPAALATVGGSLMVKLVAAALVAVVAGLLWRGWSSNQHGEAANAQAVAVELGVTEAGSVEPGSGGEPVEESVPSVPAVARRAAVERQAAPGWWLVGHITGPPTEDPPRTRVSLHVSDVEEPLTREASAGELAVSLAPVLDTNPLPRALLVRVDHPDYMPEERWLELPREPALSPGERRELLCDIDLTPAAGIVIGTVQAPFAAPDAELLVALFHLPEDSASVRQPVELVRCSSPGSFRVRARVPGRHALLACDRSAVRFGGPFVGPVTRPETRVLELSGGSVQRSDVVLGAGERIAGRVLDPLGRPLAAHRVTGVLAEGAQRPDLPEAHVSWTGEHFEITTVSADTDDLGRFELVGLAPAIYKVSASPARIEPQMDGHVIPCMSLSGPGDGESAVLRLPAPSSDVELRLETWTVRLEVGSGGLPVPLSRVWFRHVGDSGYLSSSTNEQGQYVVQGRAGNAVELLVHKVGYVHHRFELPRDIPKDAEVLRVELELGPAPAALLVELDAGGREPAEWIRLSGQSDRIGDEDIDPFLTDALLHDLNTTVRWSEDGLLELAAVDPGRYRIRLEPRAGREGENFLLPAEFELDVAPGARVRRPVSFPAGGRLSVLVPKVPAGRTYVAVELLDEDGMEVQCSFETRMAGGGKRTSSALREGLNEISEPLSTGTYRLVPRRGVGGGEPIPFEIEAGQVTQLLFDLGE